MNLPGEFAGRVAVVTGGTDGLGFDFCRSLAAAGAEVWFCGRRAIQGSAAAAAIGPRAHFFQADLAEPAAIEAFIERIDDAGGRIDYLVNNAATDDRIPIEEADAEACDRLWRVNLRAYLLVTRAALPLLRRGEGRAIVNVGTTNYMLGLTPMTVYNATKSGIVGYTRSLARELGSEGIRANMVTPGWVMTERQLEQYVTPEAQQALLAEQSLKFLLFPEHITPAVMFLLGSGAAAITGQELVVDCGKVVK